MKETNFKLMNVNQSTFILSMSISKNILLAQETVCNYHRREGNPRCTHKFDLMSDEGL
jgi:hypothetical protein